MTFQIEVGVLKTMIKTTPVEYVSTTLNTALKGAAFHWRAARGREFRGGVPAMDWSCMKVLTTAQFSPLVACQHADLSEGDVMRIVS